MNTLQFIATMTGKLAWPLAIVALAFLFRERLRTLAGHVGALLDRMGKLKLTLGGAGAELTQAEEAREGVEQAVADVSASVAVDDEAKRAIERVVQHATQLGYLSGTRAVRFGAEGQPNVQVHWDSKNIPSVDIASPVERQIVLDMYKALRVPRESDDERTRNLRALAQYFRWPGEERDPPD